MPESFLTVYKQCVYKHACLKRCKNQNHHVIHCVSVQYNQNLNRFAFRGILGTDGLESVGDTLGYLAPRAMTPGIG